MQKLKINKVKLKAFVDLGLLIVFPISAISGIVLSRIADGGFQGGRGTASSFLGVNRHDWTTIHYNFHLFFIILVIIHLILSWDFLKNLPKLIKTYLQEIKK